MLPTTIMSHVAVLRLQPNIDDIDPPVIKEACNKCTLDAPSLRPTATDVMESLITVTKAKTLKRLIEHAYKLQMPNSNCINMSPCLFVLFTFIHSFWKNFSLIYS